MRIKVKGVRCIYIKGEYIKLDALLKYSALVSTGGEAKARITGGEVFVGKEINKARGKKIKPGDVVRFGEAVLLVKKVGAVQIHDR